ncbi:TrbL/VirB6 family protein [Arthrobacter pigmenti]
MKLTPSRRHITAVLFVALLTMAFLVLTPSPEAQAASCTPPGVPEDAGSGIPGMFDSPTKNPSGETYYGQYGWAGLQWHVCELGGPIAGNEWAGDTQAGLDTWIGNLFMGLAVGIAALLAGAHKMNANPTETLAPFDALVVDLSELVRTTIIENWTVPVLTVVGIGIIVAAIKKKPRPAIITAAVTMASLGFIALVGSAPMKLAHTVDGVVADVITASDKQALKAAGIDAPPDEAVGAIFNDRILWPLWALGQTDTQAQNTPEPGAAESETNFTNRFYRINASTSEEAGGDPEQAREAYNELYEEVENSDQSHMIQTIKGQSYNRTGMGFIALVEMLFVAAIRGPAEILLFASALVFRFTPVIGPIFALFACFEKTRSIAVFGLHVLAAAVINVAIFGIIAVLHLATLGYMVNTFALGAVLLISGVLTYLFWKLAKPFRSLTTLARADDFVESMRGTISGPVDDAKKWWGRANGNEPQQHGPQPQQPSQQQPGHQGLGAPQSRYGPQPYGPTIHPTSDHTRPHPGPPMALDGTAHQQQYAALPTAATGQGTGDKMALAAVETGTDDDGQNTPIVIEGGRTTEQQTSAPIMVPSASAGGTESTADDRGDERRFAREIARAIKDKDIGADNDANPVLEGQIVSHTVPNSPYFEPHVDNDFHTEVFVPPTATADWNEDITAGMETAEHKEV